MRLHHDDRQAPCNWTSHLRCNNRNSTLRLRLDLSCILATTLYIVISTILVSLQTLLQNHNHGRNGWPTQANSSPCHNFLMLLLPPSFSPRNSNSNNLCNHHPSQLPQKCLLNLCHNNHPSRPAGPNVKAGTTVQLPSPISSSSASADPQRTRAAARACQRLGQTQLRSLRPRLSTRTVLSSRLVRRWGMMRKRYVCSDASQSASLHYQEFKVDTVANGESGSLINPHPHNMRCKRAVIRVSRARMRVRLRLRHHRILRPIWAGWRHWLPSQRVRIGRCISARDGALEFMWLRMLISSSLDGRNRGPIHLHSTLCAWLRKTYWSHSHNRDFSFVQS